MHYELPPGTLRRRRLQVYEFSLNVSKGTVDATEAYDIFRSDVATVQVQARILCHEDLLYFHPSVARDTSPRGRFRST